MELTELERLPEECMAHVLSLTSPKDACRSAAVSSAFRSAAQSQTLWERFLPHDYRQIISRSVSPPLPSISSLSNKDLYFRLCDSPIFLDDGNLSFSLDKLSGKKCWMLGARLLSITWADTPEYWEWNSLPESRFSEVAELRLVWWLEIKGNIDTKILSPRTTYAAYLVYQFPEESQWGFQGMPMTVRVTNEQNEVVAEHDVFLADPPEDMLPQARSRGDGWMEIELGEIFNQEDDATVEFRLRETESGVPKGGLIVEGIELRPKLYI
ncbi:putative F-box protein PP2-B12 [Rosa sericea]